MIEGKALEMWVVLLNKEEIIRQIQELILGTEQLKRGTTVIHGRHDLAPGRCTAFSLPPAQHRCFRPSGWRRRHKNHGLRQFSSY